MALDPECLFCKIIEGDIPADIVFRSENVVAFNDINPQAPTHVLVIPTVHTENAAGLAKISGTITAALFTTGAEAGQSVFHAHMHLLGGRGLAWPPG
jgi:histidine triad (HIT) family protein